jgi:RHS repeat-associated protein
VVKLTEGANAITVTALNEPGNSDKVVRHVKLDTTPPDITINSPSDSSYTNHRQITIRGTVSEPVFALTVDHDTVSVNEDGSFSAIGNVSEGQNTYTIRATDLVGNSAGKQLMLTGDFQPPALSLSIALGSSDAESIQVGNNDTLTLDQADVNIIGRIANESSNVVVAINQIGVTVDQSDSIYTFSKQVSLEEGFNTFEILATDQAGNSSTTDLYLYLERSGEYPLISVTNPADNLRTDSTRVTIAGSVRDTTGELSLTIGEQPVAISPNGRFNHNVTLFPGYNYFSVRAVNGNGDEALESVKIYRNYITSIPPDPEEVAPPIDSTIVTTMQQSTEFLYNGDNPIQRGVEDSTIKARRAGVVRGKVLDKTGTPLSGVLITILAHPEYGYTISREDGRFDMAVNGGGNLIVNYKKDDYLPVQRQVDVPLQDYAIADSVMMIHLDPHVTALNFSDSTEVAQGGMVTDADGSRQATLMFDKGTTATMVLPDGSTQALDSLHVRATEYTVGKNGPASMPAKLPPSSGYTYAVDFSVDEAIQAGATEVRFDKPVINYVENFVGFPVGTIVPSGYYDREAGQWVASQNGKVIGIQGISGGMAQIDVDGDGIADPDSTLLALGIDQPERKKLASLYVPGQSLWRVEISHFTPWDHNWPYGPPADAEYPMIKQHNPDLVENDKSGCEEGSIISVENQTLGEAVDITGAPCGLYFNDAHTKGYKAGYNLPVSLTGTNIPSGLKSVKLKINVAGTHFDTTFSVQPNLEYRFLWNGKDAYGRMIRSPQKARVKIGYVYDAQYYEGQDDFSKSFGNPGKQPITGNRETNEITLWQSWSKMIGNLINTDFGGWHPGIHHKYDLLNGMLYKGNGIIRPAESVHNIVRSALDGNIFPYYSWVWAISLEGVAVGPDGSLYAAFNNSGADNTSKIFRRKPDGTIETVMDIPSCHTGVDPQKCVNIGKIDVTSDGTIYFIDRAYSRIDKLNKYGKRDIIVGANSDLYVPWALTVTDDGSIYVADVWGQSIKKVGTDGTITPFAGESTEYGFIDDDPRPALDAKFMWIQGMDIGPDGSLYVADSEQRRIRKISPDGIITTVAGRGQVGYSIDESKIPDAIGRGDGGPATSATLLRPYDVAVGKDGSLYITEISGHRIRKVTPDGIIYRYVGLKDEKPELRKYYPNNNGGFNFNNGPAAATRISSPDKVAIGADGNLYFTEWAQDHVRMVESKFDYAGSNNAIITSKDGKRLFLFDLKGKHQKTLDALTGQTIYKFKYDSAGFLSKITDIDGLETTIERTADETPTAIVSPFGQRTGFTMGPNGYLASIQNPEGETWHFTYADKGLLLQMRDPKNNLTTYTYDSLGRISKADYPNGGSKQFAKQETADGFEVTMTTAEGSKKKYEVEKIVIGTQKYTNSDVNGLKTVKRYGNDGSIQVTNPDGTIIDKKVKPDPRFSRQAPLIDTLKVTTPSGLVSTFSQNRTITQYTGDQVTGLTDSLITNGKVTVSEYDGNQHLTTTTSPEGRQTFSYADTLGWVIQSTVPGLAPVNYTYNSDGFLTETEQGGRTTHYTYNDQGWVKSVTDPLGRTDSTRYDSVGRVTRQVLSNGKEILYSYDANGNLTSITPPGRPAHTFSYTTVDQKDSYTPPTVPDSAGGIHYLYNRDKQLVSTIYPDSSMIRMVYDTTNGYSPRPKKIMYDHGITTFSYDSTSGNLASVMSSNSVMNSYQYDGSLTTQIATQGPVNGTIGFTYNNDFRVTTQSINGAHTVGFSYDDDGLLIGAGALSMSYDAQNGLLTADTLGSITGSYSYNSFGELTGKTAAYSGSDLYQRSFSRDSLGRITSLTETIGGQTDTYAYTYSTLGYLVQVKKNGSMQAKYEYDANGNRTATITSTDTVTATYDAQDRMLSYGATSYTYGPRGDLQQKIAGPDTTTYDYDNLGNLRSVILPNGTTIAYLIDGNGRRVAKKVNGQITKRWLYGSGRMPVAELDSTGNVEKRYGPGYFVKNDSTYREIKDHLGSVRMIVNAQTGEVVQRIDYDAWGQITELQNQDEFTDIGFGGGLYDKGTGLVRFGARDYDPEVGRWTTKDPILFSGGVSNLYEYVVNDPINATDINGLQSISTPSQKSTCSVGVSNFDSKISSSGNYLAGISYISGGTASKIGAILKNRAAYGEALPETIVRFPGFNATVSTDLLKTTGTGAKVVSYGAGVIGLGITAYQYNTGQISGVEASFDAIFGVASFFPPFGTAASIGYFGGKAVNDYFFQ